jgi:hypothetical protein
MTRKATRTTPMIGSSAVTERLRGTVQLDGLRGPAWFKFREAASKTEFVLFPESGAGWPHVI